MDTSVDTLLGELNKATDFGIDSNKKSAVGKFFSSITKNLENVLKVIDTVLKKKGMDVGGVVKSSKEKVKTVYDNISTGVKEKGVLETAKNGYSDVKTTLIEKFKATTEKSNGPPNKKGIIGRAMSMTDGLKAKVSQASELGVSGISLGLKSYASRLLAKVTDTYSGLESGVDYRASLWDIPEEELLIPEHLDPSLLVNRIVKNGPYSEKDVFDWFDGVSVVPEDRRIISVLQKSIIRIEVYGARRNSTKQEIDIAVNNTKDFIANYLITELPKYVKLAQELKDKQQTTQIDPNIQDGIAKNLASGSNVDSTERPGVFSRTKDKVRSYFKPTNENTEPTKTSGTMDKIEELTASMLSVFKPTKTDDDKTKEKNATNGPGFIGSITSLTASILDSLSFAKKQVEQTETPREVSAVQAKANRRAEEKRKLQDKSIQKKKDNKTEQNVRQKTAIEQQAARVAARKKEVEDEKKRAKGGKDKKKSNWLSKIIGGMFSLGKFLVTGIGGLMFSGVGKLLGSLVPSLTGAISGGLQTITGSLLKNIGGGLLSGAKYAVTHPIKTMGAIVNNPITRAVGSVALRGGAMLLSGPVGWAAAAAATVYGGYKLYKYLTRNDISDNLGGKLTRVRMLSYGINDDNKDLYSKIFDLEMLLKDYTKFTNYQVRMVRFDKDIVDKILGIFGVDRANKNQYDIYNTWFAKRFLPAYIKYVEALWLTNSNLFLDTVSDMKAIDIDLFLSKYNPPVDVFDINAVPNFERPETSVTKKDFDIFLTSIKDEVKKQLPKEKSAIEKAEAANKAEAIRRKAEADKAVKESVKPVNNAENPTKTQETSTPGGSSIAGYIPTKLAEQNKAANESKPDPNQEGEPEQNGKAKSTGGGTAKELDTKVQGKLNMAPGALIPGNPSLEGIKLNTPKEKLLRIDPNIFELFTGMAKEYNNLTGKTIQVNEAFRTEQDQINIQKKYPDLAAAPKNSMHEFGLALDVAGDHVRELDKIGLLKKYGFTTTVGQEDWHIEPIGVSLDPKRAKHDPVFRKQMIDSSPGRGGGGYGFVPSARKKGRNFPLQQSIYKSGQTVAVKTEPNTGEDPGSTLGNATDKALSTSPNIQASSGISKPEAKQTLTKIATGDKPTGYGGKFNTVTDMSPGKPITTDTVETNNTSTYTPTTVKTSYKPGIVEKPVDKEKPKPEMVVRKPYRPEPTEAPTVAPVVTSKPTPRPMVVKTAYKTEPDRGDTTSTPKVIKASYTPTNTTTSSYQPLQSKPVLTPVKKEPVSLWTEPSKKPIATQQSIPTPGLRPKSEWEAGQDPFLFDWGITPADLNRIYEGAYGKDYKKEEEYLYANPDEFKERFIKKRQSYKEMQEKGLGFMGLVKPKKVDEFETKMDFDANPTESKPEKVIDTTVTPAKLQGPDIKKETSPEITKPVEKQPKILVSTTKTPIKSEPVISNKITTPKKPKLAFWKPGDDPLMFDWGVPDDQAVKIYEGAKELGVDKKPDGSPAFPGDMIAKFRKAREDYLNIEIAKNNGYAIKTANISYAGFDEHYEFDSTPQKKIISTLKGESDKPTVSPETNDKNKPSTTETVVPPVSNSDTIPTQAPVKLEPSKQPIKQNKVIDNKITKANQKQTTDTPSTVSKVKEKAFKWKPGTDPLSYDWGIPDDQAVKIYEGAKRLGLDVNDDGTPASPNTILTKFKEARNNYIGIEEARKAGHVIKTANFSDDSYEEHYSFDTEIETKFVKETKGKDVKLKETTSEKPAETKQPVKSEPVVQNKITDTDSKLSVTSPGKDETSQLTPIAATAQTSNPEISSKSTVKTPQETTKVTPKPIPEPIKNPTVETPKPTKPSVYSLSSNSTEPSFKAPVERNIPTPKLNANKPIVENKVTSNINSPIANNKTSDNVPGVGTNMDVAKHSTLPVEQAIKQASKMVGVNPDTMMTFAKIESSLNPNAKSKYSSAGGLFQIVDGTWNALLKKYGKQYGLPPDANKYNPFYNSVLGAQYAKDNLKVVTNHKQVGVEEDTAMYTAHFLGPYGAKKLFDVASKAPETPAAQAVAPASYNANRSIMGGKTVKGVIDTLDQKVDKAAGTAFKASSSTVKPDDKVKVPSNYDGANAGKESTGKGSGSIPFPSTRIANTQPQQSAKISNTRIDPMSSYGTNTTVPVTSSSTDKNKELFNTTGMERIMSDQLSALSKIVDILSSINGKVDLNKITQSIKAKQNEVSNDAPTSTQPVEPPAPATPQPASNGPGLTTTGYKFSANAVDLSRKSLKI